MMKLMRKQINILEEPSIEPQQEPAQATEPISEPVDTTINEETTNIDNVFEEIIREETHQDQSTFAPGSTIRSKKRARSDED